MSWLKRRGQNTTPSPAPTSQPIEPVPMYNPNQANHWQANNWNPQQQQQYVPSQQVNYWEQSGYTEQQNQQIYNPNPQQYHQYSNQNAVYGNPTSQGQTNQVYGNLQYNNSFQNVVPQNNQADSWGNWGWGDEDNSNVQSTQSVQQREHLNPTKELSSPINNDETWNWSVEEPSNQGKEPMLGNDNPYKNPADLFPKVGKAATARAGGDVGNLDNIGNSLPSLAAAKRNKLETPQLSMDSQMSQESSDDILQTSESDNHLASSSTVSHSPLSGHDNLLQTREDLPLDNLSSVYQLAENSEIIQNSSSNLNHLASPAVIPQQGFTSLPPTALASKEDLKSTFKKVPNVRNSTLVSSNQGSRQNMYHQPSNQSVNLETLPDNSEHPDVPISSSMKTFSTTNLPQTSILYQNWQDNNEAPMKDRNEYLETGQLSEANQLNFPTEVEQEVVHIRPNQEDTLPPPGLRRMIPGQIEQQATTGIIKDFRDEPPPGLSRMVPGRNEVNPNNLMNIPIMEVHASRFDPTSPPEGLRRMVPGESSSPENSLRQPAFQVENTNIDDSDPEFSQIPQLRSATIGADTPPATSAPITTPSNMNSSNRSETIGAADLSEKAMASSTSPANAGRVVRKIKDKKFDHQRRDFIEGQPIEADVSSVTAGVRNLTVGENSTDDLEETKKPEPRRKQSRQDTSESEHEKRAKSPRERKERRVKGDRRDRDHYSPDPSRDRRYDRRKYKDRHYDDADYYSDGEREKSNKDRGHDNRYYSLQKDKERDRRRRESPREYERENRRKREQYYHRYDGDAYDNEERSRPSSRSDSMHDAMYRGDRRADKDTRERRRERPRESKHRRPRDSYNPYVQGYGGYDPYSPYYQQYQYQQFYENLRRTNPQAYAEIYRKYYEQHASRHPPAYGTDDRSSVHSGRSSANDDLIKDRFTRQSYYSQSSMQYMGGYYPRDSKSNSISGHYDLDESSFSRPKDQTDSYHIEASSTKLGRVTPAKFNTAHTKVSIRSGRLIKVLPNYPQDGQLALVELLNLEHYLQADDEFKELSNYPGPLIKDVTHKKTVIEYCENKIKNVASNLDISDPESYILMWEFLILLLRQNGKVVGTDIAELLLKNQAEHLIRPSSVLSNISTNTGDIQAVSESSNPLGSEGLTGNSGPILKEEEITNKFREYLLYGSGQEALEWAMRHGLWGHALFLASKLGKRTYSSVMIRFANGLTINDPLQTLYQLLSGRMPAAVALVQISEIYQCVADEKWGDWKPHLAMILSNSSLQPDLNRKAITALGDTLMIRGSLYAAQFCYLMAEVGFGRYGEDNIKVVLLGSNHNKPFFHFATNEAIHMTEIYEYACSLNDPEFALPELQVYKYLLAAKLADRGLLEKSLAYLERISLYIINNPSNVQSSLVNNVCTLADRLKYYDPIGPEEEDENVDGEVDNRLDNSWLKGLRAILNDINMGLYSSISNYTSNDINSTDPTQLDVYDSTLETLQPASWSQSQNHTLQYQTGSSQADWQSGQPSQLDTAEYQQSNQQLEGFTYQDQQQQYWSNQQQQQQWDAGTVQASAENSEQDQLNHYDSTNAQNEDEVRPQISIPNQSRGKSIFDDEPLPHEKNQKVSAASKTEPEKQKQNSSGWFGGIFSKLALKPKNQMKLPDDKNPSIVWDQEKKSWVNVDDDNGTSTNEIKPPPKIADMKPVMTKPPMAPGSNNNNSSSQMQTFSTPLSYNNSMNVSTQPNVDNSQLRSYPANQDSGPQQGNMFKLQRNRNLKKSYIDVFNPGGTAKAVAPMPNLPEFSTPNSNSQINFFVPQPVNDPNAPTNFLMQGTPIIQPQQDERAQGKK
ncbi:hypothetical protein WA026_018729 [Henosepilachna vigintioctopunctata]|uniref:Sec16 Sec23-binding domain-containing protein n=1 Tax=Henosepilachna vigintioctopunctata TaxID=420089 RepID=A0AAW1TWY7_9CUCU